jgi:hypothetical protein
MTPDMMSGVNIMPRLIFFSRNGLVIRIVDFGVLAVDAAVMCLALRCVRHGETM